MRRLIPVLALALAGTAVPAFAQSYGDQQRWNAAQARYDNETRLFQAERDRYYASVRGYREGYRQGYGAGVAPPPPPRGAYNDDRDEGGYDPSRYYRPGQGERVLAADDRVYRGTDGRYYCKRNDGTTGLIVGAAGGGILGNVIDGGHSRIVGTLIGGAAGALAGKAIDQNTSEVRCR
jgi:hypothetical protein